MLRGVAGGCGWLIFEFKCIIERTVVLMYSSEERGNTEAQREGDNTNTILLQFRSRDEEAAVSSSMMIHHPTKIEGARAERPYHSDSTASRLLSEVRLGLLCGNVMYFHSCTCNVPRNLEKLSRIRIQQSSHGIHLLAAYRHRHAYNAGDYLPSVLAFHRQLIILSVVNKWKFTAILDGASPAEKAFEHQRRVNKEDSISINSTYIAMCAKVCRTMFIDFVVAPEEADMQVGRRSNSTTAMGCDSDLIAFGNKIVVMIDNYHQEKYRIIDMTKPITEYTKDELPLYYYYHKYGIKIIHWWAATMGCDISEERCGIKHIGRDKFLSALESFEDKDLSALNEDSFAEALAKRTSIYRRLRGAKKTIRNELKRVGHWFTERGRYYDNDGNICTIDGVLAKRATRATRDHMEGMLDPKSCEPFTAEQLNHLDSLRTHNLAHKSYVDNKHINGLSLPEGKTSVADCSVNELKAMIIPRGGGVTGRDGNALKKQDLVRIVNAYLHGEKENSHTVYFDRTKNSNGLFAKIDTSQKATVPEIITKLLRCGEHEDRIQDLFVDLLRCYEEDRVIHDFTTISLTAPDLKETFMWETFAHVGDSTNQKTIRAGLMKVLDMQEKIYHAIVMAEDGKSMYIISKQHASQTHDEKTRKQTPAGERPLRAEYLVMMHLAILPTTHASHGHTLGLCLRVMRSYCGLCKAGCGMCIHRAGCLWMQHLHWGEGRPTPKPSTAEFCTWLPGSNCDRTVTTLLPAARTSIMQLPGSNEEAKRKHEHGHTKTGHVGETARYDWHGGNEKVLAELNDPGYTSKERVMPFLQYLQDISQDSCSDDENE
eukprot:scaffold25492_cov80-Skeletonema_dohrnii-CCMP3373.AAC.2